jgi:hypothetical protein
MRARSHVCRLAPVVWLVGLGSLSLDAHQDPCHQQHLCPSDHHTYVCGDRGRCDQCPDNQYCLAGQPRPAASSPSASMPPAPMPAQPSSPGGMTVCFTPGGELYRPDRQGTERGELEHPRASLQLHLGADRQGAARGPYAWGAG